ncbi:hypothetical protein KC336_g2341 [Hortaea werneckii]|nr:hypothetical protein KC336_g2341 [Hortaea werneckii]
MYPLVCIFAFLGLALAAPTTNNTTTTGPTIVTNPTSTTTQASMLSNTTTTPSSTPCSILIENTPWLLTDITHFTPSLPSQNHTNSTTSSSSYSSSTNSSSSSPSSSIPSGFISFHFHDTNKGLGLETRCFRTFPPRDRHGSSEVDDKPGGGTYFPCEDGRVRFAYTAAAEGAAGEGEGELKVGRVHRDDCLWQANASAGEYDDHHDIVDEYDDGPRRLVLVGKVGDEDHGCDVR